MKPQIRVCIHKTCCQRGSEKIYTTLKQSFSDDEADIAKTENCFRFCESGPNIAVNGAVLHRMSPGSAPGAIRRSLAQKNTKKDAVGTRSIDELDQVLDSLMDL